MATTYTVDLVADDGTDTTVKIIDSLNPLPSSDIWEAEDATWFGTKSGTVSNWATGNAILQIRSLMADGTVTLEGFTKKNHERLVWSRRKNDIRGKISRWNAEMDVHQGGLVGHLTAPARIV